ncbi:two-component signal transduction histidine kinase [Pedobacter sp. BAL39]|uniref:sensor histidine kinase n=1 Tax=Pedobacter sp. BAL39 TaxID=391596 RepID=UPI0001559260|nr:histidine kinase [Pedobacter sp. BAL39]EDM34963.1 two-component signal transduction histidine kinase [Pedobacter sp. BAL39]
MKQKKLLSALVLLFLCLPQLIFAQKGDVFSKMKAGDWFEVLVSDTARKPDNESYRYQLRYELKNIDVKGNKEYALTFERIRVILSNPRTPPLGFDSYYPPYEQGLLQKSVKPSFLSKVDPTGKILTMKPVAGFPIMHLNEIATRKTYGGTSVDLGPLATETASAISNHIMAAIAHQETAWHNGQTYKTSNLSFILTAASFPIETNVLIHGNFKNLTEHHRQGLDLYLPGAESDFKIDKDGNFSLKALLSEGSGATLTYRYSSPTAARNTPQPPQSDMDVVIDSRLIEIPLFLAPGDTLFISGEGSDLSNTFQFSGKAAAVAKFGLELAKLAQTRKTPEIPYGVTSFSAENFANAQEADEYTFKQLIEKRQRELSKASRKYHQTKFAFEQANARLDFVIKTKYKSSPEATAIFEEFPAHFFKMIDTLPVLMTEYQTSGWYSSFLNSFHLYISDKTSQLNGGGWGFFLGDYVPSLNNLRRYALYCTLADAFSNEIRDNNWQNAQTLQPYYQDFINNCGDTLLTNEVSEKWNALARWAPGNQIPLKHIRLSDGSLLELSKYKGKALSITFNFHYPDEMKRLLDRIKNQDPKKIHFLIVQLKEPGYPESTVAEELKKLPQVSYVEVTREDDSLEENVLLSNFDMKTFVMDAEQTIIQDNINDSPNKLPQDAAFDAAVKKALAPKTMSSEDKAEWIKITGWSFGSILVAGLIFFWIYKVRIANIRTKEYVKRQIKELEIKAIRSQMNPHFMFNALNSIQSLINNHQYKEANIYLEKFSLLMRRVLNNSEQTFVSLSDEIEAVTLYAELEKLRFDFVFNITLDDDLNTDLIEIPGMIIQPLVENAIIHGIAQQRTAGILKIRISKTDGCLKIAVIDNGPGLITKPEEKKSGFGLKLVRERLHLLNTQGALGDLKINDNLNQQNRGVNAVLTIPID